MIHLILCGGRGTRLWPLSRECKPKQFIHFLDSKSLFQRTALGNEYLSNGCIIVCNSDHYSMASQQLLESAIKPIRYILEPIQKNTAAAICLGLQNIDSETIVLITPADHYIQYSDAYFSTIKSAQKYAKDGYISVIGLMPLKPETGFGYIETADQCLVKRFHEKPDLKTAKEYLNQGSFYWNSGLTCAKAGVLLKAMEHYSPEVLKACQIAFNESVITHFTSPVHQISQESMEKIPALSLEHALLEKMQSLRCVIGSFAWSDIGSFDSLFTHLPKDISGNAACTESYISINSKNNLIMGNQRIISTIDMENLVVVDTADALLILPLESAQKVGEVFPQLKKFNFSFTKEKQSELSPKFTTKKNSQVKSIVIPPGKKLPLHKHLYRNEYWIVATGSVIATLGGRIQTLTADESIFIPQGVFHQMENPGSSDLVILEVQYGEDIAEEDIVYDETALIIS